MGKLVLALTTIALLFLVGLYAESASAKDANAFNPKVPAVAAELAGSAKGICAPTGELRSDKDRHLKKYAQDRWTVCRNGCQRQKSQCFSQCNNKTGDERRQCMNFCNTQVISCLRGCI